MAKRIVVGISGASGSVLALRLLEELRKLKAETHVIVSEQAGRIMHHETGKTLKDIEGIASNVYDNSDFFSPVASGSFITDAMVIIPCSMKTLAGIACGYSDNLMTRAADVCLKERRRLVLVPRETPLSAIHTENMARVSRAGAVILPPVLTFYSKSESVDEHINHIIGKILDVIGIRNKIFKRWKDEDGSC